MLFFKLLGKRGAAITEYAVLLAFVAVIATSFTKSDGLEDSMRGFISRVEKTVGVDNNYPENVGGSSGEGSTEEGGSSGSDSGNTGGGTETGGSGDGDNGNTGDGGATGGSGDGDNGNTGDGTETGGSGVIGGGNYGFVNNDTENAYKGVVDSLINYLLTGYGPNLVSAEINGKNCKIQYKDGNGEIQTNTINFVGDKNFEAAGYEVQNAKLSFVDGALDTSNYQNIELHVKGTDQKDNTWLKMNSDHKFYAK